MLGLYSASKFGIRGLMTSLRAELTNSNVDVSIVCPGEVTTNIVNSTFGASSNQEVAENLEDSNVLPKIREAKARVYAEGSQPKLRTSLNHWMKYVATVAHVSFLRPRVGDDPDA